MTVKQEGSVNSNFDYIGTGNPPSTRFQPGDRVITPRGLEGTVRCFECGLIVVKFGLCTELYSPDELKRAGRGIKPIDSGLPCDVEP